MEEEWRQRPEEQGLTVPKQRHGRLKLYIGPVNGCGKTYELLQEGQLLKRRGVDVAVAGGPGLFPGGLAEPGTELESIPGIPWPPGNAGKQDLDVEAILARHPDVLLIDGLAHRNRPEARRRTRLDDIRCLLARGISVITTVNVYELDGANEEARALPCLGGEAAVSADVLALADEVRLIDVTPETMMARLSAAASAGEEGAKVRDAPAFRRDHVALLRELALRLVAKDAHASLAQRREAKGMDGPAGSAERILVAVQYHWNGSLYIRRGQQIAKRLNGDMLVAAFIQAGKKLSREEIAFRRSMRKLTEKVGGRFEERPLSSRRSFPDAIIRYAAERQATRLVLGHSKRTRLQELWHGSAVNGLLRKMDRIDLFFMADRSHYEGERMLSAKMREPSAAGSRGRTDSPRGEAAGAAPKRGIFKVYVGAAPGVGKTYAMLREGNELQRKGLHVAIGLLETHGRSDTQAQVGSLPTVPRRIVTYRGARLEEMDTEAVLRTRPDVVLVDELAHTNVPGSARKKRYMDVLELLNAGISVISTVNVQHLESLNDAVAQLTGIRVRETVPDRMLHAADEVQLIDLTPQMLRQRMREGKIYAKEKIEQALSHFFKTVNLIALRELALREIADDVDDRLESWERTSSLRGPWRRHEAIIVCVPNARHAETLIRRGFRISWRLKAEWHVIHVRPEGREAAEEELSRIARLEEMTVRLGGTFQVHGAAKSERIHQVILRQAAACRATQLIVGQPRKRTLAAELVRGSTVRSLLRHARDMDVLVVSCHRHGG
ncbi:histidine kinase [Paenibacillus dendritiformis]|uniref:universal stress protein n=1 Tax=Paenibacillus dendritiformis TaxID=130049 RepID=UPI0018CE5F2F|nr:universal stress protein [Paenibacillus dendritiformis]MBG9791353.1 histidine kinase [Paenibacillus dendritiformis]